MPPALTDQVDHAAPETVRAEILGLLEAASGEIWTAAALHEHLGHTILDVVMALARLTHLGEIERTSPGRYTCCDLARSATGAA